MRTQPDIETSGVIEMHLPGGFSRLRLAGLAHGEHRVDVPTEAIPLDLRAIGTVLQVQLPRFAPESSDTPDEIRAYARSVLIRSA